MQIESYDAKTPAAPKFSVTVQRNKTGTEAVYIVAVEGSPANIKLIDSIPVHQNPIYTEINRQRLEDKTSSRHQLFYKGYTGPKGELLEPLLLLQNIYKCELNHAFPITSVHAAMMRHQSFTGSAVLPWTPRTDRSMVASDKIELAANARVTGSNLVFIGCKSMNSEVILNMTQSMRVLDRLTAASASITCVEVSMNEVWTSEASSEMIRPTSSPTMAPLKLPPMR